VPFRKDRMWAQAGEGMRPLGTLSGASGLPGPPELLTPLHPWAE
jgi:hypothetical protein